MENEKRNTLAARLKFKCNDIFEKEALDQRHISKLEPEADFPNFDLTCP